MTDEPRDELDRALGARLGRLGGDGPDVDATLAELQPRFRRARTRARVVRASAVALVAIVMGAGVFAFAANGKDKNRVSVAASTTTGSTHDSTSTSLHRRPTTTTTPGRHPTPTTLASPRPTMVTVPFGGGNEGSQPTTPPTSTGSTPETSVPGSNLTSYSCPGGRLTVRFEKGWLTLTSVDGSPGWTSEVKKNASDEIEVRFSRGESECTIHLHVQDGRIVRESDE